MAKLFTGTTFNNRAVFPRVAGFVAVTAYDELVIVDHSTPFTTNIERIRDGWRGEFHFDRAIAVF